MTTTTTAILSSINASTLRPIVRQVAQRDDLEVTEWHVREVGGGVGNPVSLGVYRFEGMATGGDRVPWSAILKLLQSPANAGWVNMGEGDDQTHWNYWKRELLVYRSAILSALPPGLAAPRCYGAVELPGDVAILWLEDLGSLSGARWSLDQFALAARHLGRFNGAYASPDSQPSFPWLSRRRHRQWLATAEIQRLPWDHPLVTARYPGGDANAFRRMLTDCDRFLTRLDHLGLMLSHGDTYPTNLMMRGLPDGGEETVALDWALLGLEPPGTDLGQLTFGAQNDLAEERPDIIADSLFESYLDGLRDAGCRIDPKLARFGFMASAALRIGLFQLILLSFQLAAGAEVAEDAMAAPLAPDPFETVMARRAYELLGSV
jgi:hypothetical protein